MMQVLCTETHGKAEFSKIKRFIYVWKLYSNSIGCINY
jgi:hypothetical protein